MDQKQKQKSAKSGFGGGLNEDLSVTHEIKAPSIEQILAEVKKALDSADSSISSHKGGRCGCF